jgi:hypothetical protein
VLRQKNVSNGVKKCKNSGFITKKVWASIKNGAKTASNN